MLAGNDRVRTRWTSRRSSRCSALTQWRPVDCDAIEAIWYVDGAVSNFRELHLPTGCVDVVVQLDDAFRRVNNHVEARYPAASISGLQAAAMRIEAFRRHQSIPHRTRIVGIRFNPAVVYALLGRPLEETTGRVLNLQDVLGTAAHELIAGCADARDGERCVRHVAQWAHSRIVRSARVDRQIHWCAVQIQRSFGRVTVGRLQQDTGLTSQQITNRFRLQIGMTPKLYARIVRLRRALTLLHLGLPAATVAATVGYYDQPHMNGDFRTLAGMSPRQYLAARHHSATTLAVADTGSGSHARSGGTSD
jgi:AraC-like DNA-binding protein